MNNVTFKQTEFAAPMGEYKQTKIDELKQNADFLLQSVNPYYIKWKNGTSQRVTSRQLESLKKSHTWQTDF